MSDPQALHVTRNVIPGKLGVDLHLHRVHIPLVRSVLALALALHAAGLVNTTALNLFSHFPATVVINMAQSGGRQELGCSLLCRQ